MKRFSASIVALAALVVAAPAFAEVQNVRVGGDITVRGIWRDALRFSEDRSNGTGPATGNVLGESGQDAFFQSALGLNVSADLTDNVSVDTRLLNQRVWGSFQDDADVRQNAAGAPANFNSGAVDVALAYVTLKELFYSPLTVRIGRQNLWYGRGMIVGSRLLASDADPANTIVADEFTENKGFDAIRATLDFDPVTVDLLYSKVDENASNASDDVNLAGINLGYKFSCYNAEMEAYYFVKHNDDLNPLSLTTGGPATHTSPAIVNVFGVRGSMEPVSHLTTFGEVAVQFGDRDGSANALNGATAVADAEGVRGGTFRAWMANLGLDYVFADTQWTPRAGIEWTYYGGNDGSNTSIGDWDPMFRGHFGTLIREFQSAGMYLPSQSSATAGGTYNPVTNSYTNQQSLQLRAGAKPLQDLDVSTSWTLFWQPKGSHAVEGAKETSFIGHEWDTQVVYDYTEDVQFGLIYGVLWPGHVFRQPYDSTAQELVSSVKVSF